MRPAALALILATVPAPAGAACDQTRPEIAMESRTAALTAPAVTSPTPEAPGLYSARVTAAYGLETAGQGNCARVTAARVVFTHAARVDIAPGRSPCAAAIIEDHEAAHAAADRAALAATRERMARDLPLLLAAPVTPAAAHDAMRLYLTHAGETYARERDRAHALIDSPAAMAHAAARLRSCTD